MRQKRVYTGGDLKRERIPFTSGKARWAIRVQGRQIPARLGGPDAFLKLLVQTPTAALGSGKRIQDYCCNGKT